MIDAWNGLSRRRLLAVGAGLAGAALTGCGVSKLEADEKPAGGKGFPVEVRGELGVTKINAKPAKVVSVGQYRDTDAAVALGVVPVATPDLSMFIEGGIAPWVRAQLGGSTPQLYPATQLPFERISLLDPDLILATDRSTLDAEYKRLSGIAPTLSAANGFNKDPWQLTTRRVGTALGRKDKAEEVVRQTEAAISAARKDNPGFTGKTFTLGPVTGDGAITTINSETDASAVFMSQLGLKLSPQAAALPQGSFPGRAAVSPERLEVLNADVMVLTFMTDDARKRLEAQPLFQRLPAVRNGGYIPLDFPTAIALGFPSALSIQYGLEQVVPKIKQALAG